MLAEVGMPFVDAGSDADLVLDHDRNLLGFHGRRGALRLLTTEDVRRRLDFAHARHIYWLVQQGYLPVRRFGRELVFLEQDITAFKERRGR
jgi:hypothetical protein